MNIYRSLLYSVGVTDEVSECSCCGKTGLKRTKVFKTNEGWQANGGDEFVFLGSTCARRNYKGKSSSAKVNAMGQTDLEVKEQNEFISSKIQAMRNLVSKGYSLPDALSFVRHLEAVPNGKVQISRLASAA